MIKRAVGLRVQLIERIEVQSKFEEEQRKCDQEDTPSYRCVTRFHVKVALNKCSSEAGVPCRRLRWR
jgi:hypothetical protein